jgi:4-carboxymuconolactone decarboxylase
MSRLKHLRSSDLDPAGLELWDRLVATRGPAIVAEQGFLVGPYNAWIRVPQLGTLLAGVGSGLQSPSIDPRLQQLAIVTVVAHWKAEFEWWAHAPLARGAGVSDRVIDSLAKGEVPPLESESERAVYAIARDLVTVGGVAAENYQPALDLFGENAVVELVTLCGFYTMMSFFVNAFEVPLPPGALPAWHVPSD